VPFRIYKMKNGFFVLMHDNSMFFTNDLAYQNAYKNIILPQAKNMSDGVFLANDSTLLAITSNYVAAINLLKSTVNTTFLNSAIFPRNTQAAYTIGNYLHVVTNNTVYLYPSNILTSNCVQAHILNVRLVSDEQQDSNAVLCLNKNQTSCKCYINLQNLDNQPYTLQYKLDNADSFVIIKQPSFDLQNITFGKQKVEVQLLDAKNKILQNFELYVQRETPIHRQLWFQILAAALLALLALFIIRTYYSRRNKQRQLQAEQKFASLQNELKAMYQEGDVKGASNYLQEFSNLVRKNMRNVTQELISLQDELEVLKGYLTLESLRYEGNLQWKIKVDDAIDEEEIKMPPLLLQPIVENSIKHGLFRKEGAPNIVEIRIILIGERIVAQVLDSGIGFEESAKQNSAGNQMAYQNIEHRIEQLNLLRGMDMSIRNFQTDEWCVVEIRL
jgi:Histidine kinase